MTKVIEVIQGPQPVVDVVALPTPVVEVSVGLRGPQGVQGADGAPGAPGADGQDGAPGLNGTGLLMGEGFPEGAVTAPVGSFYSDTAVTAGASLWRKASGSGATGWVAVQGDTGGRTVTPATVTGVTVSSLLIRRVDSSVEVHVQFTTNTPVTLQDFFTFPTGFRPIVSPVGFLVEVTANAATARVRTDGSSLYVPAVGGNLRIGYAATGVHSARFSFITVDQWPTTLPGTPA